jgi:histidyl-tRNA synthetase
MQIPAAPKGTRDFYPDDMALREAIFSSWRATCERYAFEPYDAPTFEHLELYTQKSGDEIEKQLYVFEDKAQRRLALRPELTPSLARMVAARGNTLKRPVRWYSIPRLYRYEKMQKGRLREFFQLNMDILGIPDVSADAELIAASIDMMRDLGFPRPISRCSCPAAACSKSSFFPWACPKKNCFPCMRPWTNAIK